MASGAAPLHEQAFGEVEKILEFVEAVHRALLNRPPEPAEFQRYANLLLGGVSPVDFFNYINASDERRSHAKLFAVPGSPQSPVANPAELAQYVRTMADAGPDLPGVAIERDVMVAMWERLLPFITSNSLPERQTPGFRYYANNLFFGLADALVLQAMLRLHEPKRYVEIGSGFSSACAADTVDHSLNGACQLTFIEPQAERLYGVLGERARNARVIETPVQGVPPKVFEELEANDILFIDSSHVMRTGSDVCYELFEILPRLRSGVIVHIHDVIWPFDYPANWILEQNRSYNEAYAVRAFLTNNDSWQIIMFNDWFAKFEGPRIARALPSFEGGFGGSLWLRRR